MLACLVGVAVCAPRPQQYQAEEIKEIIVSIEASARGGREVSGDLFITQVLSSQGGMNVACSRGGYVME